MSSIHYILCLPHNKYQNQINKEPISAKVAKRRPWNFSFCEFPEAAPFLRGDSCQSEGIEYYIKPSNLLNLFSEMMACIELFLFQASPAPLIYGYIYDAAYC